MAGQVDLAHRPDRNALQIVQRVEAMVAARDIDVVDVQQQLGAGGLQQLGDELPLAHLVGREAYIAGHVLQHQRPAEQVLHLGDAAADMVQRRAGERHRQQIMQLAVRVGAPAQVVRHPAGLQPVGQGLELAQIGPVQRLRPGDRHRHAMHDQRVVRADALQMRQRRPAGHQVVLGNDLQPVRPHAGIHTGLEGRVMLDTQTEAEALDRGHTQDKENGAAPLALAPDPAAAVEPAPPGHRQCPLEGRPSGRRGWGYFTPISSSTRVALSTTLICQSM
mmetsp:Transcript_3256/g.5874  ORF Transcript_3256/g.5874 Transcript_3256/m.5874 type:complete len:277 (+) Transcript_3256:233-1063(+)